MTPRERAVPAGRVAYQLDAIEGRAQNRRMRDLATQPAADAALEPWLNLSQAARLLQIAPRTLRLAAEAGEIEAIYPLPEGPWIFSRAVLSASPARTITERARQNPKHPRVSHPDQQKVNSDAKCNATSARAH